METLVFERDDKVYIVGPVTPFDPGQNEIDELAFAKDLMAMAPNANLGWLRGQYVEADRPNKNGAMWTSDEIALKSLTPMFMPVTFMHDPRINLGLIADVRLFLPDEHADVERARLDTTLGIWRHRFPTAWDEIQANYEHASLMQSMECLPAHYDCVECGRRYPKLPGGAEKANWCEHLRGETAAANGPPVRRLGNVTFTGTGIILGTRGATGAFDKAHLDVFQDEVAEFHQRAHRDSGRRRKSLDTIEIPRTEYTELQQKAGRVPDLERKVEELAEEKTKREEAERKLEETETAKVAAESEVTELKGKVNTFEEEKREDELASTRLDKLGKGFLEKLGEFTRGRLEEQAKSLSDDEWENALKEREEMAGVKRDTPKEGEPETPAAGEGTFSREETARTGSGGGNGNGSGGGGGGGAPTGSKQRSVVRGLVRNNQKQKESKTS